MGRHPLYNHASYILGKLQQFITNGKTLIACYLFVSYTLIIIWQEQKVGPVRMYPWRIAVMNNEVH